MSSREEKGKERWFIFLSSFFYPYVLLCLVNICHVCAANSQIPCYRSIILTTPENTITYHNALSLSPQILHKRCFQFLLGPFLLPRGTEDNAYAKFWSDKKRAVWYVMVFLEWSIVLRLLFVGKVSIWNGQSNVALATLFKMWLAKKPLPFFNKS